MSRATAELIPVTASTIDKTETLTVNARELHSALGVKRDFSNWIKARIEKYEFTQGIDFVPLANFGERPVHEGGANRIDYILTVDMAKQLTMVENNETGRRIRKYFIACERQVAEAAEAARSQFTLVGDTRRPEAKSTVDDRRPLNGLINTWTRAAAGVGYNDAWHQIFGRYGVGRAKELTLGQVQDACAWVQERIEKLADAHNMAAISAKVAAAQPPAPTTPRPLLALPEGQTIELPDLEEERKRGKAIKDAADVTQNLLRPFFKTHGQFIDKLLPLTFHNPAANTLYNSVHMFGIYVHTLAGYSSLVSDMVDQVIAGYELVAALQQGQS